MRTIPGNPLLRFAPTAMASLALIFGCPAIAQEPELPDEDLEAGTEEEESAEEELPDADEEADETADFVEMSDDGESVADASWYAEWWVDASFDAADDAIPSDTGLDPTGLGWEVVEYANDGDAIEDLASESAEGIRDSGDMPVIRPRAQRAPAAGGAGDDTPYSFGGNAIRDAGAAWQAQIFYPGNHPSWAEDLRKGTPLWQKQHYCGGTLIANDWVLTAAHCIDDGMVRAGYKVRLGAEDISKAVGMTFRIDRIVRHSQYSEKKHPLAPAAPVPPPNMYSNDIALVHIVADGPERPRDPQQIRPIGLYKGSPPRSGTQVTGSGWGKTQPVDQHAPNALLLKVDLQVMDVETCKRLPGYGPERISDKVICAARKGQATCRGDSGGPLTLTNGDPQLVGIISWGKARCNGDGRPGVYTSVVAYSDWIQRAMKLDPAVRTLP